MGTDSMNFDIFPWTLKPSKILLFNYSDFDSYFTCRSCRNPIFYRPIHEIAFYFLVTRSWTFKKACKKTFNHHNFDK